MLQNHGDRLLMFLIIKQNSEANSVPLPDVLTEGILGLSV